jgi:hypothetical protein
MPEPAHALSELDELAFRIFERRVAQMGGRRGGEKLAVECYREAEEFLAVKKRGGEPTKKDAEDSLLADCCAPNLRRTHPHNLVSRRMGDINKVNRNKVWLYKNPTP